MLLSTDEISRVLSTTPRRRDTIPKLKHSAVMMILLEREWGGAPATHLVFIMKTRDGSRHAGQIAFPGGKVDADDESALAAALRETHEELGVTPAQLEVLGGLGYFSTMTTGFDAAIFMARPLGPLAYAPQHSEVAAIFEIPLDEIRRQFVPNLEMRTPIDMLRLHFHIPVAGLYRFPASDRPLPYAHICIWGFTARVLQYFLQLLEA